MSGTTEGELSGKLLKGSVWLFGAYALSRVGRLAMMLVVAAVLTPADYGVIGLCAMIIIVAQLTNEFGIWQAVVHRSEPDERFLNTAFTANLLVGFAVTSALMLSAPWIAGFFAAPQMTGVLRVLSLALIADAAFYVPDGLLRKQLDFKSRALPEIAGTFGAGVVTTALLLLGAGVLSYAFGFVVESCVRCALTFGKIRWRPRLQIFWPCLRDITSYGKHILGADLGRIAASNVDYLIVGRVLGAGPLGLYTLAFNLANYPVANFTFILSRIAFPTFAALREDAAYARQSYLKMIRLVAVLVAPLLGVFALLAEPLVVGLLGEKWRPAVFPLQVLVIAGISRSIAYPGFDMLRAMGFPSVPFKITLVEGLLVSGAVLLVASRGIEAVALSVAVVLGLTSWATTLATCRKFGVGLVDLGGALWPGTALALSGAAPVLLLRLLAPVSLPVLPELALLGAAAATGTALCLATTCRGFYSEVVALASAVRSR